MYFSNIFFIKEKKHNYDNLAELRETCCVYSLDNDFEITQFQENNVILSSDEMNRCVVLGILSYTLSVNV